MTTIVTTQEELDAAIKSGAEDIVIDSPPNVWLELQESSSVEARGSSHVYARERSTVWAGDQSHVVAAPGTTVHACPMTATVTVGNVK